MQLLLFKRTLPLSSTMITVAVIHQERKQNKKTCPNYYVRFLGVKSSLGIVGAFFFFVFPLLLGTLLKFPPHRRVLSKERDCVDLATGTPETAKDVIIKHANDPFYPGQGSRACAEGRVESRFFFKSGDI